MSFFDQFKIILKRKWLEYYKANRSWIKILLTSRNTWVKTPDQGKRPSSDIIIGSITALEPKLVELMPAFCELTNDGEKLIKMLGLDFDPDLELEKQAVEASITQENQIAMPFSETDEIEKIRQQLQKGEI